MLAPERIRDLAGLLERARVTATAVEAPSRLEPSIDLDDAYRVQEAIIAERLREGRRRVGWKMGLTTAGPGVTPIVGTLLDDAVTVGDTPTLRIADLVGASVEAELAVRIGATVDSAVTVAELLAGPHAVGPGIEVIDYRTRDAAGPADWVADNATIAHGVFGEFVPVGDVDSAAVAATLSRDGEVLGAGVGERVMGNPLAAVAWLSGHLAARGQRLEEGDLILTGSLTGFHPAAADTEFTADFGDLGTISVRFEG